MCLPTWQAEDVRDWLFGEDDVVWVGMYKWMDGGDDGWWELTLVEIGVEMLYA